MARRSDHTKDELKEMAVTAGYNLIKSQGFSKFSARKVAAEIGYTVGTIYNIFDSHDHLILHINARTLDGWYASLEETIATSKKPPNIHNLAKFYIDYSAKHYNEWSALFEHTISTDIELPEWYIPKMRRFFDLVETIVMPHVKNNRRKARRSARVLWAGIHGICILSLSRKLDLVESESATILAKSFVDNYLRGLQYE
jgi:AcrR family transcriptional regulator